MSGVALLGAIAVQSGGPFRFEAGQSLSIGQTALVTITVSGSAVQSLSIGQTAVAAITVSGSAGQALGIGQSAHVGALFIGLLEDDSFELLEDGGNAVLEG